MVQKQKTEKERERLNDGNNDGQLRIANATSGGAHKATWAKIFLQIYFWRPEKKECIYRLIHFCSERILISVFLKKILQGLRVAQAAVTERWP